MSEKLNDKLLTKVIGYFLLLAVVKIIYEIFFSANFSFFSLLYFFVILFVVALVATGLLSDRDISSQGTYRGGSVYLEDDKFDALRRRYEKLAEEFVKKKAYKKAAYVHLKLLQNPHAAANILKDGELYPEAAYVFLKKCKNKLQAAECHELGRNYTKSIELYKEIDMHEKVGDLYAELKDDKNAIKHYTMVKEEHEKNEAYYHVFKLLKDKMKQEKEARSFLLKGWEKNREAELCLNTYFNEFTTQERVKENIEKVYRNKLTDSKKHKFLNVLKKQNSEKKYLKDFTQNIAYEMISKNRHDKFLMSNLSDFVREDNKIQRDISVFKNNR